MSSPTPNQPTKYLGTQQFLVPFVSVNRRPLPGDVRNPKTGKLYPIATIWQVGKNPTTGAEGELWLITKIVANIAFWQQFSTTTSSGVFTLSDTAGTVVNPDGFGNIQLRRTAGGGLNTTAGTNLLDFRMLSPYSLGDFSFENSTASTSRTLQVLNSGTGTTSTARLLCFVNNASTADAVLQVGRGAGMIYGMGTDTSDSDTLKWTADPNATGAFPSSANVLLTMTPVGQLSLPQQSSISAQKSASTTNATGDGTTVIVVCNSVFYDQHSEYNNATGVMTFKQSGRYIFNATVCIGNIDVAHQRLLVVLRVGTAPTMISLIEVNPAAMVASNGQLTLSGSAELPVTVSDTAQMEVTVFGGTKTVSILGAPSNTPAYCAFSAHKVA